ncbi:MAG: response regulator [Elusimicrobiota bacterium]
MTKKKVVVVDDDESVQEMLKVGLESCGYEVEIASNESDFRRLLKSGRPDVILMDVSIPGLDGISLCRELRYTPGLNDIPILIISAYSDRKTTHDAFLFGASDFLVKPFDIISVKDKIEKYIKGRKVEG